MSKYLIILVGTLYLFCANLNSESLKELQKMPLDSNSFALWDNYIKKYAPSDSAYSLLSHFARVHLFSHRPAVAYHVYLSYQGIFPKHIESIKKMQNICIEQAIGRKISRDQFPYYHNIIITNVPSEEAFIGVQRLAGYYLDNKYIDSASFIYKSYKDMFRSMSKRFDKIIDLLDREEDSLIITHFKEPLNTVANEWDPTPSPDGKRLFFSSNRRGTMGGADIWLCDLFKDSIGDPKRLAHGVNSKKSETIDNVLFDGSGLTISGDLAGTFGKHDIYTLIADTTGKFSFKHLPYPINTEYTDESANISADGQALLFCSDRPGGVGEYHPMNDNYHGNVMGNTDLYVCIKEKDRWSEPINLGEIINTPYAERTPYLHPDGKTLYFSSDGHYGLGGLDVFVSRRLNDKSWTEWSEPVNLGRFVNTCNDDWGYKVSLDGKVAYFTADNLPGANGGWDIYKLELPEFAQAEEVLTVTGSVKDAATLDPISTLIKYEDLSTGEVIGELISNPLNGAYMLALPGGKNYGIYIEKSGYLPYSTDVNLKSGNIDSTRFLKHEIRLQKIESVVESQKEINFDNVYFDYDKAELKKESLSALKRFVKFLNKETEYKLLIEGHTDESGSDDYNMELSAKRANAVKEFLLSNGIDNKRLNVIAFGKSKPISVESRENRRVSFRLILK